MESLIVVVSFHYLFVTKVRQHGLFIALLVIFNQWLDFRPTEPSVLSVSIHRRDLPCYSTQLTSGTMLQCLFGVWISSALGTTELAMAETRSTECRYDIRVGGPEGPIATFIEVGQRLFHEWSCEGRE